MGEGGLNSSTVGAAEIDIGGIPNFDADGSAATRVVENDDEPSAERLTGI